MTEPLTKQERERLRDRFPDMVYELDGKLYLHKDNIEKEARRLLALDAENQRLRDLAVRQAEDLLSLTDAFHDAINCSMGVVPESGERFYDQDRE